MCVYRPFSNLSKRTIGFVNENDKGAGLEFSFNDQLERTEMVMPDTTKKSLAVSWKPIFDANNVKAIDGLDIQTTLDINLTRCSGDSAAQSNDATQCR